MGKWFDRLKADPTEWLLEKACPPIRLRLLQEVLGRPSDDPDVTAARQETYSYKPALTISGAQGDDGTWFSSIDGFEPMNLNRKRGPGTLSQYWALIEYGWGKDHPIIWRTSEILQGIMWEDPSVDLFELNGFLAADPAIETWIRKRLSRAALMLLVRTGFNDDAGVQMKSKELVAAMDAFYDDAAHEKIYDGTTTRMAEVDGQEVEQTCHRVSPEALLPGHRLMTFLAHCPQTTDTPEGRALASRVANYVVTHPSPGISVVEVAGKQFEITTDLGIRCFDKAGYAAGRLIGRLLQDLEILARTGGLANSEKALGLLDWLLDAQDAEGVVRADDITEKTIHRIDYPYFPLEDNWRGKHKKYTDITFRLLLILKILDTNPESQ